MKRKVMTRLRQEMKLRRERLIIETLEPRLLLARDISAGQIPALVGGLDALTEFGERLDTSGPLAANLPLATHQVELGSGEVTSAEFSIGEQIDIGTIVFEVLTLPATTYLESSLSPTSDGLVDAITTNLTAAPADFSIDSATFRDESTAEQLEFAASFVATRVVEVDFDLETQLSESPLRFEGGFTAPLELSFAFDATIRLADQAQTPSEVSFEFGPANRVTAGIDFSHSAPLEGRIGLLGVEISAGEIKLQADLPFDFQTEPGSGGHFLAGELLSQPLSDLVTIDTTSEPNSFDMNLPLIVEFNGLDLGNEPAEEDRPRLLVRDTDLYDGEFDLDEPFLVLENGEQLLDFRTVSAVGIFSALEGVQSLFGQLQNSAVLQREVPFTGGATMADVLDLAGAFGNQILDALRLSGSSEDNGESGPNFESVQQMVDLLAASITYVEDDDGDSATYDPAILLDIDFHHLFEVLQFGFDLGGNFDGLSNISTTAEVALEAALDARAQLGVLLTRSEGGLPLSRETLLDDLNGGDGVDLSEELTFSLINGRELAVNFDGLPSVPTLGDLLDAFSSAAAAEDTFDYDSLTAEAKAAIDDDIVFGRIPNVAGVLQSRATAGGMFRVLIGDDRDRLEIIDTTYIAVFGGELRPGEFGLADAGVGSATSLGLAAGRSDEMSLQGRPINGRFALTDETPLDELNRKMGVEVVSPAAEGGPAINDLLISLRDGSSFEVDLTAAETIGDVMSAIGNAASASGISEFEVDFNSDYTGLALSDNTAGTGDFLVEGVNQSLAAVGLGIAGVGELNEEETSSRIEGAPLHGRTLADSIFLRQLPDKSGEGLLPMLSGTVRVLGGDIDAEADLGFVEVSVVDGSAVGQLTADISLGDTGTDKFDGRVSFNEAYDGLGDAALKVSARNEVLLPETFDDAYGGVLKFTIAEPTEDGENDTVFAIPFFVPAFPQQEEEATRSEDDDPAADAAMRMEATEEAGASLVSQLNLPIRLVTTELELSLQAVAAAAALREQLGTEDPFSLADLRQAITDLPAPRIGVGSSGNRLNFTLTDGVARQLTVSAGQPTDLTNAVGLTEDDVQLVLNLLSNIPGLGIDRNLLIDELVDSEDAVFNLGVTKDPARVTGDNKPQLGEPLSGSLSLTIHSDPQMPDVFAATLNLTQSPTTISDLADALNAAIPTDRITVEVAGDRLVFMHHDDVRSLLTVEGADPAGEELLAKLGFDAESPGDDPSAYVVRPKLSGAGEADLPIDVNLDIGGLVLPSVPEINISFPDLSLDDLSLPGAFQIDFGELGDLFALRELSLSSVIVALQTGLAYLEGLEFFDDLEFLNVDLPMIDLNLRDMLNIADAFGDILIQLEVNPVAGLAQLEEFLEDAAGIPEDDDGSSGKPSFPVFTIPALNQGLDEFAGIDLSDEAAYLTDPDADRDTFPDLESFLQSLQGNDAGSIDVSLDREGADLAVRIDIGLNLLNVNRQAPLQLDLSSLDIPGLSDLVDVSTSSMVSIDAGALIGLSLGIDLTNEEGVKPFLYDVEDVEGADHEFTGTRVELLVNANSSDIQFSTTAGPLGVQIGSEANPGSLSLSGPIGESAAGARDGQAKLTIGLGNLLDLDPDDDGRHYFEEIVARGDTIHVAAGRRGITTENGVAIELPAGTDLSEVSIGDLIEIGGEQRTISGVDDEGDRITVSEPTSAALTSARWEITRGTAVVSGNGGVVAEDLLTVVLSGADLSAVMAGNTITLAGQTGGIDDGDTFEITAVDSSAETVTLATQPSTDDSNSVWSIRRKGDFEFLLDITDLELDATGSGSADLPVSFVGLPAALDGSLAATVSELTDFTSIDIDAGGSFAAAKDFLTGNFNLSAIVGGWEGAFDLLLEAMRGQVFGGIDIPLIGDALKDQADFLEEIKESVGGNLEDNAESDDNSAGGVQQALYDALGPGGLNWLQDLSGDTFVTIDDVVLGVDPDNAPGFIFDIHLAQDLLELDLPIDFDIGVPGLDLAIAAPVSARLGFDVRLTFGLNIQDGFYIDTGANNESPEIQVFVDVAVPGLAASGSLGFLRIDAVDIPTAEALLGASRAADNQMRIVAREAGDHLAGVSISFADDAAAGSESVSYDAAAKSLVIHVAAGATTAADVVELINSQPPASIVGRNFRAEIPLGSRGSGLVNTTQVKVTAATRASGFRGSFDVDLVDPNNDDGKLTLGEIFRVNDFSEVIELELGGVADINIHVGVDMSAIPEFPSLRTNFGLDWDLGLTQGLVKPTVQFTDVEMNLGEFFGGFVGSTLGTVQDVLGPIQPVIDVLAGPVPVISDLARMKISFIDLAKLYGGTAQVAGFLEGVAIVATVINSLPDVDTTEWLNFGGFRFDVDLGEIVEVFGPARDIFEKIQEVSSSFDPSALLPDALAEEDDNTAKLSFPILSQPSLIFDLMTGKDVDLFTFELPTFDFSATFSRFFPIPAFPVLGAEIAGTIGAEIDLAFGYDTGGLRRFFATDNPASVADGLFLFDHENADGTGDDLAELILKGAITAGPKAIGGFGSAFVRGGIFASIDFDLNDPNEDGKIRGLELLDNSTLVDENIGVPFLHIFDVSGKIDARLEAGVELNVGLFTISKSFTIAEIELLSYDFPRPDGNAVPLARLEGSTLRLNIGPDAALRHNPVIDLFDPDHDEDVAEEFRIAPGPSPGSVIVSALGREQTYTGVTLITGNAGNMNDRILVSAAVTVRVDLVGGPGNDTLLGGGGSDRLDGGAGNDDLRGGPGNDTIAGGAGDDLLSGEQGSDRLSGGSGNDTLDGGDDDDTLKGQAGFDILVGGSGNDRLEGGDDDDDLEGQAGSDSLLGGAGDDRIFGGRNGDHIWGDSGNDELHGEEGSDVIHGGPGVDVVLAGVGNDTVFGDGGDDRLFGENSRDTIWGGDGNDLIQGGLASDDLFGGLGNDRIFATDDVGTQDQAEHTLGGGGGDDWIVAGMLNDTIHGDGVNHEGGLPDPLTDGNDTIFAQAGDDLVQAGGGNDLVYGGLGRDDLYGGPDDDFLYATDDVDTPDPATTAGHSLYGGGGNDFILAHLGDDFIQGDGLNALNGAADPASDGDDLIYALAGSDQIDAGNGDNTVYAAAGDDVVVSGTGSDVVFGGTGNDDIRTAAGTDFIDGQEGDDLLVGGLGDDNIIGGPGNDLLFGGLVIGTRADFDLTNPANFVPLSEVAAVELLYPTLYTPPRMTPKLIGEVSVVGVVGDGRDSLDAGPGNDFLFGGFEADILRAGDGNDYVDAGGGDDVDVDAQAGDDIVRGGLGNDALVGGSGIDQIFGDQGDDTLFGDVDLAGGNQQTLNGQRLFGGEGRDQLFAFAPTATSAELERPGDQLFGGPGGDFLRGNLRSEVLHGGGGNDFLHGDILGGPLFATNQMADTVGSADLLLGGSGEDQLFGGGGADVMWGGAGTDFLEGQQGADVQYGGSGIDLFVAPTTLGHNAPGVNDTLDGHHDDAPGGNVPDDNATDILVIGGTGAADTILLSQTLGAQPQLHITHPNGDLNINWLDVQGTPLLEQFQIAGLGGDDAIGFALAASLPGLEAFTVPAGFAALDLSELSARSSDFVGVFDGNSGDDVLLGSLGRDRLDGGRGSDTLHGFAGDDRLWGDGGEGSGSDTDRLFAGGGNDDLLGGQGSNNLYAWSFDPSSGTGDFGVFVDIDGRLVADSANGTLMQEVTGLNRIVGSVRDDNLFGGTTLDFLHGNGGNDTLYRADGSTFTSLDGGTAGDAWKDYARESDKVWYVGGTNADDEITVDFVTEPGVLSDHHLVTRLTDNGGNFSFAAQLRLDFGARDEDGELVWDANDVLLDANARIAALDDLASIGPQVDDQQRADLLAGAEMAETTLIDGLLPGEGDFLVIVIDAHDGNDQIRVGPTVQKSVWVDAGGGDDRVEIRSGSAILTDRAESVIGPDGLRSRNDVAESAFGLTVEPGQTNFTGLTIDNPDDTDWFRFTLPVTGAGDTIEAFTASLADELTVAIFAPTDLSTPLIEGAGPLEATALIPGGEYLLRVESDATPTIYDLLFNLTGPAVTHVELGIRSDAVRRDVIFGGPGNDVLQGGAGEDFIFGEAGNDVLNGGKDRNASDLLFGGRGNDTFQIIPDFLPLLTNQLDTQFDPATETFVPTFSEQMFGGDGNDRILFLGGDFDRLGREVADFAAIRYNTGLHRYEFTSLVWDIANQRFATETITNTLGDTLTVYQQQFQFFQVSEVEQSVISTRAGDDLFHGDAGFKLLPVAGNFNLDLLEEWGIDLGDLEQRAEIAKLDIRGGDGDDRLFGGAYDDRIDGGSGADLLIGNTGNDWLIGGSQDDELFGLLPLDPVDTQPFFSDRGSLSEEYYEFELAAPLQAIIRPGVSLDGDVLLDSPLDFERAAFALEGDAAEARLSRINSIGDFNGDGNGDFIVTGDAFSFILLRSFDLIDHHNIAELADIIIDHNAFGRPASGSGDIDADGFDDLAFVRDDPDELLVVYGGMRGGNSGDVQRDAWPRLWDQDFVESYLNDQNSARSNNLFGAFEAGLLNPTVEIINYDGDGFADLLVATDAEIEFFQAGEGGNVAAVLSGADISSAIVRIAGVDPRDVVPYGGRFVLNTINVGDVNGDRLDDILLIELGNASLILGGSLNLPAGNSRFDIDSVPIAGDEMLLAGAVGDLDGDGLGDFVLYDRSDLFVYLGTENPTAESWALPDAVIDLSAAGTDGNIELAATSGDFNGDGAIDLALTTFELGSEDSSLYVFTDVSRQLADHPFSLEDAAFHSPIPGVGSLVGGPQIRNAIRLGPAHQGIYFSTAGPSFPDSLGDVTTSFWFHSQNAVETGIEVVRAGYQITISPAGGSLSRIELFPGDAAPPVAWDVPARFDDGRWRHVTVVRDATNNRATLYIDGRSQGQRNVVLSEVAVPDQVVIGAGLTRMDLDDMAIWNRALTRGEVEQVLLSGPQTVNPDGALQLHWDFENVTLQADNSLVIPDLGSGNEGTLDPANNSPAAITLPVGDAIRRLPVTTNQDLNGDGSDDILVLDPGADSAAGLEAGRIYAVYGIAGSFLPSDRATHQPLEVTSLENASVPGSGSYLVDRGIGRPAVFTDAGQSYSFSPGTEIEGRWFEFTTLGDGGGGNGIRIVSQLDGVEVIADLLDGQGRILAAGQSAFDLRVAPAGRYLLRVYSPAGPADFSIEFDAPIRGQTRETNTVPDHDLLIGRDGDDFLVGGRDRDVLVGNSGSDHFFGESVIVNNVAEEVEIHDFQIGDVRSDMLTTDLSLLDVVRPLDPRVPDVLAGIEVIGELALAFDGDDFMRTDDRLLLGNTIRDFSVAFWLKTSQTGPHTILSAVRDNSLETNGIQIDGTQLTLVTASQTHLFAIPDIIDDQWHHVAVTVDHDTLSNMTSSVFVDGLLVESQATSPAFDESDFVTVMVGQRQDPVTGGVINGQGLRGALDELIFVEDHLTAAQVLDIFENRLEQLGFEERHDYYPFSEGQGSVASSVTVFDGMFAFGDGDEDQSPSWTSDNPFGNTGPATRFVEEHVSRLAGATRLDASGRGLEELAGFEARVNLRSLDLSDNDLDAADLSVLAPHVLTLGPRTGEPAGMPRLEVLNLANNPRITDISHLAGLAQLQSLNLQGTGVNPADPSTLAALANLTKLRVLHLPVTGLLGNTNLAADEGESVTLGTAAAGYWSVEDSGGNLVVEHPRFPELRGGNGQPAVVVAGADAPTNGQVQDQSSPATLEVTVNGVSGPVIVPLRRGPAELIAANPPAVSFDVGFTIQVRNVENTDIAMGFVAVDLTGLTLDQLVAEINSQIQQSADLNGQIAASNEGGRLAMRSVLAGVDASLILEDELTGSLEALGYATGFLQAAGSELSTTSDNQDLGDLLVDINDAIGMSIHSGQVVAVAAGNRIALQTVASGVDVRLRVADSGAGQSLGFVPQAPSDTIQFTPADNGVFTVSHDATVPTAFPLIIANLAPVLSAVPLAINLTEGESRTASELTGGIVVEDVPADEIVRRVTVTDSDGRTSDLTAASLTFNDDAVVLPHGVLAGAGDVTTTFWLKSSHLGSQTVLSGTNLAGAAEYLIQLDTLGEFKLLSVDGEAQWPISVADGAFHHFAIVRNSTANHVELFVDGQSQGERSGVSLAPLDIGVGGLAVGQDLSAAARPSLQGTLDELSIWRRALTAEQILAGMNGGFMGNETGLAGYWRFNDGAGLVARDSTGANDGLLRGGEQRPAWSQDLAPGAAAGSYAFVNQGPQTLTITVSDDDDGFASAAIPINVTNIAPLVDVGMDRVAAAGNTITVTPAVSDPGLGDLLSYDWEISANNGLFVPPSVESVLVFTPQFSGRYTVTLEVTDSDDASGADTVVVDVLPTAAIVSTNSTQPATGDVLQGELLTFSAVDPSLPPAIAARREYSWEATLVAGGQRTTGNLAEFQFIPEHSGQYELQITVTDVFGSGGNELRLSNSTLETVDVIDTQPTIIGPSGAIREGDLLEFSASGLAPLPPLGATGDLFVATREYSWTVVSDNGQILESGSAARYRLTPDDNGQYTVNLTVTDTIGSSTGGQPVFTVATTADPLVITAENRPPAFAAPDVITVEGTLLSFSLLELIVDPGEADTHDVSWLVRNESGVTVASGGGPDFLFTPGDEGRFTVEVMITDDDSATIDGTFDIAVRNTAPVVDAGGDQTVNEGHGGNLLLFAGAFLDAAQDDGPFAIEWDFGDGNTATDTLEPSHLFGNSGVYNVTLTVTDSDGGVGVDALEVHVTNLNPVIDRFEVNSPTYTVGRTATFSGRVSDFASDRLRATIDFGDGSRLPLLLRPAGTDGAMTAYEFEVGHIYSAGGDYDVRISVFDQDGGAADLTTAITDTVVSPGLFVTLFEATASGFVAHFNSEFDPSVLNLYDTQRVIAGLADVSLTGQAGGPVAGSLVLDPSNRAITFIKTGGPLATDTYTVVLRSASDAFTTVGGELLDGDADGTAADDFFGGFTVEDPAGNAVTISAPDFVRGPGQEVNLPADTALGIPLTLSGGSGVRSVRLRIDYDPALLSIESATVGSAMPAGATVSLDTSEAGTAIVVFDSPADLPAGSSIFASLRAAVPAADASGFYGQQHVLDFHSVSIRDAAANELPVVADDAFHLASYFADVSGNGRINASDASRVARFAALLDSGFASSLLADPILVGDVSENQRVNAADASRVARFAALIDVPEIPPIPGGIQITGMTAARPGSILDGMGPVDSSVPVSTRPATDEGLGVATDLPAMSAIEDRRPHPAIDRMMAFVGERDRLDADDELPPVLEDAIEQLFSLADEE